MQLLEALALAFINTFGITHPGREGLRRASWFILLLLAAILCVVVVLGAGFFLMMRGRS